MLEQFNYITCIGFIGQGLFFSRFAFQLFFSEKQKKIATPSIFWKISLIASIIFFIYGYLREDLSIMIGQLITYFIYIRNLQLQGEWKKLALVYRSIIIAFPFLIISYTYANGITDFGNLVSATTIETWLLILGIAAQIIFVFRFVFQWISSERNKKSNLPIGFWVLSFIGALLIVIYSIFRMDLVLFIAHSIGLLLYLRNMFIWKKQQYAST